MLLCVKNENEVLHLAWRLSNVLRSDAQLAKLHTSPLRIGYSVRLHSTTALSQPNLRLSVCAGELLKKGLVERFHKQLKIEFKVVIKWIVFWVGHVLLS